MKPSIKVTLYGIALVAIFGAAWFVGGLFPQASEPEPTPDAEHSSPTETTPSESHGGHGD